MQNKIHASTFFGLLAEFGTTEIPLEMISLKYFGMDALKAKREAAMHGLPVPAYRGGSQKSPWLVSAHKLAEYLDTVKAKAVVEWEAFNN